MGHRSPRYLSVFGPASCACLLVCVLGISTSTADDFKFVVNGILIGAANEGNRTCGLYAEKSLHSGSRMAFDRTNSDGKFKLIPDGASGRLREQDLWVICLPQRDIACKPQQLAAANYSLQHNNLIIADVELTCTSSVGAPPEKMAEALAALAETHEVLAWAGVEELDAADAALKNAVARADAEPG
jgi:hypothetical protein